LEDLARTVLSVLLLLQTVCQGVLEASEEGVYEGCTPTTYVSGVFLKGVGLCLKKGV
jgi:hypothetical protein